MDTKLPTSFIPKKPVIGSSSRASGGIFYTISVIVFVFAFLASVGVYGYEKILAGTINKMDVRLSEAKEALQPEVITELSRANNRFLAAEILIKKHTVLSSFFSLLESLTLEQVRFTTFSYFADDLGKITVMMKGEASSYATVALQSNSFSENANFFNPQFSDLDLNEDGNVIFGFKSGIDPKLISYQTYIDSLVTPVSNPPVVAPQAETATPETTITTP